MNNFFRQVRHILLLIGTKGTALFLFSIAASLGLSCAEYGIAVFLMLFLSTLGFIDTIQLPAWLPDAFLAASPWKIWGGLFLVVTFKAICDIITYQTKILFTEGTYARMRALLGYEVLKRESSAPMPLSRVNLFMGELFPKATSFIFHITQFFIFFIQAVMISGGMFFLCRYETVVGICALGLMGSVVLSFNRRTHRIARKVPEAQAGLERTKVRIIRNSLLIKILRLQDREYDTYLSSIFLYFKHSVTAYFWGNLGGSLVPVLGVMVLAVIVFLNLRIFHTPAINLVAFLYLFIRFQQKIANLSNTVGGLFINRSQFRETAALFATYPKAELAAALPVRGGNRLRRAGEEQDTSGTPAAEDSAPQPPEIHLSNVSFSWPDALHPVFENISLIVPPGSQLGIMGENGSGKSTLLNIILGVLPPQSGQVFIGARAAGDYFRQPGSAIGYVGPEPFLIHGSIRENLTYGLARPVSDEDLRQVLEIVGLDAFVRDLPGQAAYVIQENGDGLSSGQKQRLSIARAFFRRPSFLILDEPLSNVDEATEKTIVDALAALKGVCTTIMVSHRMETLSGADQILRLQPPGRGNAP